MAQCGDIVSSCLPAAACIVFVVNPGSFDSHSGQALAIAGLAGLLTLLIWFRGFSGRRAPFVLAAGVSPRFTRANKSPSRCQRAPQRVAISWGSAFSTLVINAFFSGGIDIISTSGHLPHPVGLLNPSKRDGIKHISSFILWLWLHQQHLVGASASSAKFACRPIPSACRRSRLRKCSRRTGRRARSGTPRFSCETI